MDTALTGRAFAPADTVDFVIVGSGAAGGVMARELSRAGFSVVVLEQGPYLTRADFHHDDVENFLLNKLTVHPKTKPITQRPTAADVATQKPYLVYAPVVGGSSVHYAANYWRWREVDFLEKTRNDGGPAGTTIEDWPFSYDELEPYYSRVEWEVGVSGQGGVNPRDAHRSRPYPMPPLPLTGPGALLDIGAKKLGWLSQPAPMAIASRPYRGRSGCASCGFCWGYGCEWGAKSSTLFSMLPEAVATGRCEIRPHAYAWRVDIGKDGRVTGVSYFDAQKRERLQKAKAVVLCGNGAETPRLLLMSASPRFPQGLANGSGLVGKNLMFNGNAIAGGKFEHPVNGHKGAPVSRIVLEHFELDKSLGILGGAGLDFRAGSGPLLWVIQGGAGTGPRVGMEFKHYLRDTYTRSVTSLTHCTSLPAETNTIDLDPTVKDAWGLPAIRVTYRDHDNDVRLMKFMQDRAVEVLQAAGAQTVWRAPVTADPGAGYHLLGTCRMGTDPARSVVNPSHRAHDVPNLFLVDGSSFVTSGRGQPTMTIQALAFRAAEYMAKAARRNEI